MNTNFRVKRTLLLSLPVLVLGFCTPFVVQDIVTYRSVTQSPGCCGYVSENRLTRPVTYAIVDEWTTPVWTQNAIKSERWLTADGLANGEKKFWRILQRVPIDAAAAQ